MGKKHGTLTKAGKVTTILLLINPNQNRSERIHPRWNQLRGTGKSSKEEPIKDCYTQEDIST